MWAAVLFLLLPALLPAQPKDPYDSSWLPIDEYGSSNSYSGFGGGFTGLVMFPKYDELNTLADRMSLSHFEGPLVMLGGGGFGSALIIDNVRLGAYGFGGSKKVEDTVALSGRNYTRSLEFSHGLTAGEIDYAIRLGGGFTLVPGVMLGSSRYALQTTQSMDDTTINTVDNLIPGSGDANSFTSRVTSNQLFVFPRIAIEWVAVRNYVMLRLGGGYATTFGTEWRDGNDIPVRNMPEISVQGPVVQFGIYGGFFQLR